MMAEFLAIRLGQPFPLPGPVDGAELVTHLHHVRRVHREFPVDPLGGIPLLVLAALIEIEQPGSAAVVFPVEASRAGDGNIPGTGRDWGRVVLIGAHGGSRDARRRSPQLHYYPVACGGASAGAGPGDSGSDFRVRARTSRPLISVVSARTAVSALRCRPVAVNPCVCECPCPDRPGRGAPRAVR